MAIQSAPMPVKTKIILGCIAAAAVLGLSTGFATIGLLATLGYVGIGIATIGGTIFGGVMGAALPQAINSSRQDGFMRAASRRTVIVGAVVGATLGGATGYSAATKEWLEEKSSTNPSSKALPPQLLAIHNGRGAR